MPSNLTLTGARVIDGTGAAPIEDAVVTIKDGKIASIGRSEVAAPDSPTIDLGGRTLLPGLIDAHVHLKGFVDRGPGFGPPDPLKGEQPRQNDLRWFVLAKSARAFLDAGFTSVRDVGSYDAEALVLKRAIGLGLLAGPRILSCGQIISATSPGGAEFGSMYIEADGPWQMRRAVRTNLRQGADLVKLMATGARSVELEDSEPAQMTVAEMEAIVDEAHRMGVRVAAHAEGLEGTRWAVDAGVDTIEHGLSLNQDPRLLAEMAERGTVLVPTISTFHDVAVRFREKFAPSLVERAKYQAKEAAETLIAAHEAGVTLAMGYDSGPPGANATEMVRMVEGGLTAMDAIKAGTWGSAQALGLTEVGTIEVDMQADLLVVDGDPLDDIGTLTDPENLWLVMQGGAAVAGSVLKPQSLTR